MIKVNKFIPAFMTIGVLAGCSSVSNVSVNQLPGPATQLSIDINGVESDEGKLLVYLHDNSESYYSDDDFDAKSVKYYMRKIVAPTLPLTQVVFDKVPAGKYAVSVIHDKDEDGTLSRMIFPFAGMPKEPYGLSNDIYSSLTKGPFEEALVEVTEPSAKVSITLATHLGKLTGQ